MHAEWKFFTFVLMRRAAVTYRIRMADIYMLISPTYSMSLSGHRELTSVNTTPEQYSLCINQVTVFSFKIVSVF